MRDLIGEGEFRAGGGGVHLSVARIKVSVGRMVD